MWRWGSLSQGTSVVACLEVLVLAAIPIQLFESNFDIYCDHPFLIVSDGQIYRERLLHSYITESEEAQTAGKPIHCLAREKQCGSSGCPWAPTPTALLYPLLHMCIKGY